MTSEVRKLSGPQLAVWVACVLALFSWSDTTSAAEDISPRPSIVVITVDALRADRLSCYGYARVTSPEIDRLVSNGTRFISARTVVPLTNPALASMLTSTAPHRHGATRNGLRMQTGLPSLPRRLEKHGWQTAAFVSNWTLKDNLSRLGEHFQHYEEVLTRRRWLGLFNREATGEDVTKQALTWLRHHHRALPEQPVFLWTHYVEPHAPYRYQQRSGRALGIREATAQRSDRYDTEVHTADRHIGELLHGLEELVDRRNLLIVFTADHGESLGEHDYWGHGRHLYEPSLHIPMAVIWPGRIEPGTLHDPAVITDVAPTILDLVGVDAPSGFRGTSWAGPLTGGAPVSPASRCFQAQKGAVKLKHDSDRARSRGLLEVGVINGSLKEILEVRGNRRHIVFDLAKDPAELTNIAPEGGDPSDALMECFGEITTGLGALDRLSTSRLSEDDREQLRALGYLE